MNCHEFSERLEASRQTKDGWIGRCPAHPDGSPSLSFKIGDKGGIVLHCFAGCKVDEILAALNLTKKDIAPPSDDTPPQKAKKKAAEKPKQTFQTARDAIAAIERIKGQRAALWRYDNSQGKPVGVVVRFNSADGKKDFRPVSKNCSGWYIGKMPEPAPLYQLPAVLKSTGTVYVAEGEKAADAMRSIGLTATTSVGGSGAAGGADWTPLSGRDVVITLDNDAPGKKYGTDVQEILTAPNINARVTVLRLPGLPEKGDAYDFIEARQTDGASDDEIRDEIESFAATARTPEPTQATNGEAWQEPIPLRATASTPPFPVEMLSPWLAEWAIAEAEMTQTPVDLAACLALATAGAGIAGRVEVEPWEGWREPVNLYGVVVLPPGERKTVVFKDATQPAFDLETETIEAMKPKIAERESERRMLEIEVKRAESEATKAEAKDRTNAREQAKTLAKELAEFRDLTLPQFLVEDVTPEKLCQILAAQSRIFQASDEGTAFEIAKGRYSDRGANFEVYLKAHAASPMRTDRIGRKSETIDKPALSVALAVQPDVLIGLAEESSMKGRGFYARFLYSLPKSTVGSRAIRTAAMPPHVAATYYSKMRDMWSVEAVTVDGKAAAIVLTLSTDARAALQAFMAELEPRLGEEGDLNRLAGWANKLAGAIVRIAGILHVADAVSVGETGWHGVPIQQITVTQAIRLGRDYFLPHAQAAFAIMADPADVKDPERVIAWLKREFCELCESVKAPGLLVSQRDIHAGVFGGTRTIDETNEVISALVKHGYLKPEPTSVHTGRGRKPSERFLVNLKLFHSSQNTGNRSQNSQIHKKGGE